MIKNVDVIILGQGIAGTTLAWTLLEAGLNIFVVDREEQHTSSRIAAGLMTPVTGKRLATMPDWQEYWSEAIDFYRNVENQTKTLFIEEKQMLRLFQTEKESQLFEDKKNRFSAGVHVRRKSDSLDLLGNQFGGFEMSGGQLRVSRYLDASKKHFQSTQSYAASELDVQVDVEFKARTVSIPKLQVESPLIIFCQGFQRRHPQPFESVQFNPSKGEILKILIHDFEENRIIHKGIWIAQIVNNQYQVGATYDWEELTNSVSDSGRHWITDRLQKIISQTFEIQTHSAAVRPTMKDFQPVVGIHPDDARIGIFNGLGSKGSLLAPRLAKLLTQNIIHRNPLPSKISILRWYS